MGIGSETKVFFSILIQDMGVSVGVGKWMDGRMPLPPCLTQQMKGDTMNTTRYEKMQFKQAKPNASTHERHGRERNETNGQEQNRTGQVMPNTLQP